MTKTSLSPEFLRQLLRYEPDTGNLFWLHRPVSMFPNLRIANSWNARFAGKEAFNRINDQGYRCGHIQAVNMYAHRVIWAMSYGEWPAKMLDHINRIRHDNRLANLRLATPSENSRNTPLRKDSSSGFRGVSYDKRSGKWMGYVNLHGKRKTVGRFSDPVSASAKVEQVRKGLHGDYAG